MDEREELAALRRMAELEAKASGTPTSNATDEKQPSDLRKTLGNAGAGLIRGAGSIGATLLTPYDYLAGNTKTIGNPERRQSMTDALGLLGFDTGSTAFKVGKFGGEVAGTAGVPVSTGGSLLAMAGKGALSGGAAAGLIDPTEALTGAAIGGVAGPVIKAQLRQASLLETN